MRTLWFIVLFAPTLLLAQGYTHGNLSAGYWFIKDGALDVPGVVADDGYGNNYLNSSYSMFSLGVRLRSNQLFGQHQNNTIFHLDGRSLINPSGNDYTFGFVDKARFELRELAIEMRNVLGNGDLWLGRQTIFAAGGARFDGPRLIFQLNPNNSLGVYGGLGQDPRNLTGYIGPGYSKKVVSLDYLAGGLYLDHRGHRFNFNLAVNTEFFDQKIDRIYMFYQSHYRFSPRFSLGGQMLASVTPTALNQLQLSAIYKPFEKITNTLSFFRWSPVEYKQSQASTIPYDLTSVSDPTWIRVTQFNNSAYQTIRNHLAIYLRQRNYVFGSVAFTYRGYDNESRLRYSFGYRDPTVFHTPWDIRVQTDLIQNFRGFNAAVDMLLGREIGNGPLRLEGGATFYANERDIFLNNQSIGTRKTEREFALRLAGMYYGKKGSTVTVNYTFHGDVDSSNDGEAVDLHEIYIGTNLSF